MPCTISNLPFLSPSLGVLARVISFCSGPLFWGAGAFSFAPLSAVPRGYRGATPNRLCVALYKVVERALMEELFFLPFYGGDRILVQQLEGMMPTNQEGTRYLGEEHA